MANVLNRTTMELLYSVNTPDYPVEDWIQGPDLSAVDGVPKEDWVIDGDTVRSMTDSEKLLVLPGRKTAKVAELVEASNNHGRQAFTVETEMRLKLLYSDAVARSLTNRAAYIGQALTFEQTVQTDLMTKIAAVTAATNQSELDAVSMDFSATVAPDISVLGALGITD